MGQVTLEQELEALIESSDYVLDVSDGLHVRIIYKPSVRSVDVGGPSRLITNNGVIAHGYFPGWWKWQRARRFVKQEIEGHRQLLAMGVMRQQ